MKRFTLAIVSIATLTLAACGDDGRSASNPSTTVPATTVSSATSPATTSPATTVPASTVPSADARPEAIVSLSPTATEMLYALDAADQIVAVDDFSTYPPEAAEKQIGLDAYQPSVEAVAALEPDLVITDGTNPAFLAQLDELSIPHWEGAAPADLDGVATQFEQLGARIGRIGEAAELVLDLTTRLDAVRASMPTLDEPLTYYHELDATFFSVTSDTFIGAVYSELGLVNIADAAGADTAYPQLSAEFILEADPDLIFLACTKYCDETAATVAARPGWNVLTAVKTGGVVEMDDDIASRWGPRIVDYVELAAAAVSRVAEPVG